MNLIFLFCEVFYKYFLPKNNIGKLKLIYITLKINVAKVLG